MTTIESYNQAFIKTFEIEDSKLNDLSYQSITLWDSVGHMALIAALEDAFEIMMEVDDIIDFSSYEKGKQILVEKYGVQF